jgi:signal transduction histidine kinase
MFYVIISLIVFSGILLAMEYQNRYCWLFFMMVAGMVISFFSISLHLTIFGSYYYNLNRLFRLDYELFSFVGKTIKLPLSTIARMINIGIALYLLAVPLFVYEFTRNKNYISIKFSAFIILMLYNLLFYDPKTAYLSYLSYHSTNMSSSFWFSTIIRMLHQFNRIWIFAYLFYPVVMLIRYLNKTTIAYIKKQIIFIAVCIGVMNLLFYSVFFMGPFMMSPTKVFITGFWIFENIQDVTRYYIVIPLITVCVLFFTLFLLARYRLGSLVHIFVDHKIQRNISKLNDLLSDALHSEKNLLFSFNILAKQAIENDHKPEERKETMQKILELSELSLARTSEMLDSLRDVSFVFRNNNLISALEDAIKRIEIPEHIKVIWNKAGDKEEFKKCRFDFFHMNQVFVNIFNNSIEAINMANRKEGILKITMVEEFQWFIIIIEDNGIGIRKESIKKLFDPYYSSKVITSNWGLGLSYAHKILKAHFGFLQVESCYGESTSIQIMFPKIKTKGA